MNHQSLINEAPKLVAFGLRTGLLSVRTEATDANQPTQKQIHASRDGMRKLRLRQAKSEILDIQEDIGLT